MVSTSLHQNSAGIDRPDTFGRSGDTANQVEGFTIVAGQRWVGPAGCWLNRSGLRRRQTPGTDEQSALISWLPARLEVNHGIKVTPPEPFPVKANKLVPRRFPGAGTFGGAVRRRSLTDRGSRCVEGLGGCRSGEAAQMSGHDEQGLTDPPPARAAHAVHDARRGKRGEARVPPAVAVLVAVALYAVLPEPLLVGPRF